MMTKLLGSCWTASCFCIKCFGILFSNALCKQCSWRLLVYILRTGFSVDTKLSITASAHMRDTQTRPQASWHECFCCPRQYFVHTSNRTQTTGIWGCEWTLTFNLTHIIPALSHHHSNRPNCNKVESYVFALLFWLCCQLIRLIISESESSAVC